MITSRFYFKGNLHLANITDVSLSEPSGNGLLLDNYIQKYERDFLITYLGYKMYKLLLAELDTDVNGVFTLKTTAVGGVWDDLLFGKEYTKDGEPVIWRGLFYSDSDIAGAEPNRSPIANYVFCHYVTEEEFSHSGIGFQKEQPKNAQTQSGRTKVVNAWNEMVDILQKSNKGQLSLNEFMSDMNSSTVETYPGYKTICINYINRYTPWG